MALSAPTQVDRSSQMATRTSPVCLTHRLARATGESEYTAPTVSRKRARKVVGHHQEDGLLTSGSATCTTPGSFHGKHRQTLAPGTRVVNARFRSLTDLHRSSLLVSEPRRQVFREVPGSWLIRRTACAPLCSGGSATPCSADEGQDAGAKGLSGGRLRLRGGGIVASRQRGSVGGAPPPPAGGAVPRSVQAAGGRKNAHAAPGQDRRRGLDGGAGRISSRPP